MNKNTKSKEALKSENEELISKLQNFQKRLKMGELLEQQIALDREIIDRLKKEGSGL